MRHIDLNAGFNLFSALPLLDMYDMTNCLFTVPYTPFTMIEYTATNTRVVACLYWKLGLWTMLT